MQRMETPTRVEPRESSSLDAMPSRSYAFPALRWTASLEDNRLANAGARRSLRTQRLFPRVASSLRSPYHARSPRRSHSRIAPKRLEISIAARGRSRSNTRLTLSPITSGQTRDGDKRGPTPRCGMDEPEQRVCAKRTALTARAPLSGCQGASRGLWPAHGRRGPASRQDSCPTHKGKPQPLGLRGLLAQRDPAPNAEGAGLCPLVAKCQLSQRPRAQRKRAGVGPVVAEGQLTQGLAS